MKKKTGKKKASAHTCSILKKKLKSARTRSSRGKALGNFAKHGCARRRKSKH